jgi:hypothetical protein
MTKTQVEVITSVQRRRSWSQADKIRHFWGTYVPIGIADDEAWPIQLGVGLFLRAGN